MTAAGDPLEWADHCDAARTVAHPTSEAFLPWVVLFADLIDTEMVPLDRSAVEARGAEWRALFGGGGDA